MAQFTRQNAWRSQLVQNSCGFRFFRNSCDQIKLRLFCLLDLEDISFPRKILSWVCMSSSGVCVCVHLRGSLVLFGWKSILVRFSNKEWTLGDEVMKTDDFQKRKQRLEGYKEIQGNVRKSLISKEETASAIFWDWMINILDTRSENFLPSPSNRCARKNDAYHILSYE